MNSNLISFIFGSMIGGTIGLIVSSLCVICSKESNRKNEVIKRKKDILETAMEYIQRFADCNYNCRESFYYNQGCKACMWGKIIEMIKKDIEENEKSY